MIVQHNLQAMNSNRMLGITQGSLSKSTEKLSSGYSINRAADNAAGLAISEKMRKQIRGLTQASSNAEDGISAVQTAEGALTEVHDMLQRMNELATQAANGTQSETDRSYIQDEISQLTTEIDRVAETTKFNEIYLLKGDGTKGVKTLEAHDAGLKGKLEQTGKGKSTFTVDSLKTGDTVKIGGRDYNIVTSSRTDGYTSINERKFEVGEKIVQDGVTYTVSVAGYADTQQAKIATGAISNSTVTKAKFVDENGNAVDFTVREGATVTTTVGAGSITTTLVGKMGIVLGDNSAASTVKVPVSSDKAGSLIYTAGKVTGINLAVTGPESSAANGNNATVIDHTWAAGDKVTSEDGTEYTYVAANGTLNGVVHKNAGFYKSEGNKGGDIAYDVQAGDDYAVIENIANADQLYSGKISNGGIASVETIQDAIKSYTKLLDGNAAVAGAGAKVTIADSANDAGKTYEIGVTKKEDGTLYTADDVAALVKEGNYVTIDYAVNGTATTKYQYYAVPSAADSKNDITLKQAYEMMTDELETANNVGADADKLSVIRNNGDGTFDITQGKVEIDNDLSFSLHVGADADMTNKIGVNIKTMSAAGLGVKNLNVKDDSGIAATYAIDAISDAIETVSRQRSLLGAVQNRLEHTIKNLDNVVENTQSAESAIRDTDMATEMVKYSNANILSQAGQSMLAQANQSNQGVLSILG